MIINNEINNLLEKSPVMIGIYNGSKFLYINPAGIKLLGAASYDELANKSLSDLIHPAYWNAENYNINNQNIDESSFDIVEQKFIRVDNEIIDVEVIVSPLVFENQRAVQIIAIDISKRKEEYHQLR